MDPYIDGITISKLLWDIWNKEKTDTDWIFSEKTDYLIEASCPKYDEYNLWLARTKDGGWFSMNIQNNWQSGRLDVTGEIYEAVIQDAKKHGMDIDSYINETY